MGLFGVAGAACRAILVRPGTPPSLELGQVPMPKPGPGELLIRVRAIGVNAADLEQSRGEYGPPPGASPILGLELSGDVGRVGGASRFNIGDRVMALVEGGAYAEYAVVPERTAFLIPPRLSYAQAAAVPEAYFTVWSNVFRDGALKAADTLLVHGGSTGVGCAAIEIAKSFGATVLATGRTDEKCQAIREIGADLAINYTTENFQQAALAFTCGEGVDVILDPVGADYLESNLKTLKRNGRLILIDCKSGDLAQIDLGLVITQNLVVRGSVLRPRPPEEKSAIADELAARVLPLLESGKITPRVYACFPLEKAQEAHALMTLSSHIGKLILLVGDQDHE
jgi:NADPH2:quinone reductase